MSNGRRPRRFVSLNKLPFGFVGVHSCPFLSHFACGLQSLTYYAGMTENPIHNLFFLETVSLRYPPRLEALEGQTTSVASLWVALFFKKVALFVSRFVEWFSFAYFISLSTSHVPAKSNAYLENAGSMYKSLVTTLNVPETAS
jgi:hypothetical protein